MSTLLGKQCGLVKPLSVRMRHEGAEIGLSILPGERLSIIAIKSTSERHFLAGWKGFTVSVHEPDLRDAASFI